MARSVNGLNDRQMTYFPGKILFRGSGRGLAVTAGARWIKGPFPPLH